jgi:decaprenylphospho-beta-D-ribofuranose 2-oxidase
MAAEPVHRLLTGWGGTAPTAASVLPVSSPAEVAAALRAAGPRGVIARGLGRAYGDAAQSAGGTVLDCRGLRERVTLDPVTGNVTASAGVSVDLLMRHLLPRGWFVPVTPGTRQVTVGGAVAADVHGKNHHADGSLGQHLRGLTLVTPDGRIRHVSPDAEAELFWATVGGMGLTGVVVEATFGCLPVRTAWVRAHVERAADLDDALARMAGGDHAYRYSVAWIDLLARGASLGRSVLMRGDHAEPEELPPRRRNDPLHFAPAVPLPAPPAAVVPSGLLNRASVRAFNAAFFRAAPVDRWELQPLATFFHPLDRVGGWNRLYGPRGFVQYQCVLPYGAESTLREVVRRLSDAGHPSFLAVVKRFGRGNPAPLSFPMPGWTLALDLPIGGSTARARLRAMLRGLDELVAAAGGRVYLAKDSTLAPDMVERMYPQLERWRAVRDAVDPVGVMRSDLARRVGL